MRIRKALLHPFSAWPIRALFLLLGVWGFSANDVIAQDSAPLSPPTPIRAEDLEEVYSNFDAGEKTVEVIVKLKPSQAIKTARQTSDFKTPSGRQVIQQAVRARQDEILSRLPNGGASVKHRYGNFAGFEISVNAEGFDALLNNPDVESIETQRILEAHTSQGLPLMNAIEARTQYSGLGVSVAICDTGIDATHPQLGGASFPNTKVIGGYDFGDNDADPSPRGHAHGTACAGLSAGDYAVAGDYVGGVATDAKLYALKISYGTGGSATSGAMIAAWDWCVTHQFDDPNNPIMVISTSFGGGSYTSLCDYLSPGMTAAANSAVAAGITHFVSSGNGAKTNAISWPACISSVISVGAVYDANYSGFGFSNCSDNPVHEDAVTCYSNTANFLGVLAPSHMAYTADISGSGGYTSGNFTTSFGGTSAACPYAAGAAALMQSAVKLETGSFLTPAEVRSIFTNTGDPITDTKAPITKPRINLGAALAVAIPTPTPTPTPTPIPNPVVSSILRHNPPRELANSTTVVFKVTFDKSVTGVQTQNFGVSATGDQVGSSVASLSGSGSTYYVVVNTVLGNSQGTIRLDLTDPGNIRDLSGLALVDTFTSGEAYTIDRAVPSVTSIRRLVPLASKTNEATVIFRVTFSEHVNNIAESNFAVVGAGGQTTAQIAGVSATSGTSTHVSVTTVDNAVGDVRLDLVSVGAIRDEANNLLSGSYTGDESYEVDRVPPSVTSILRLSPPQELTNEPSVVFRVTFDESVVNVSGSNFSLVTTGDQGGASIRSISNSAGQSIDVTVDTVDSRTGTIGLDLDQVGVVTDEAGNGLTGTHAGDEIYSIDRDAPRVLSILRNNPLTEFTSSANVTFQIRFSRPVVDVTAQNFSLAVTAGQAGASISGVAGLDEVWNLLVDTVPADVGVIGLDLSQIGDIRDSANNALMATYPGDETYTIDITPSTPSNLAPADGSLDESRTLTLSASPFHDPNPGDAHAGSQWQIRAAATSTDYTTLAFSTIQNSGLLTSLIVPPGALQLATPYAWRVRYRDAQGAWSQWSTETAFTTEDGGFTPTAPDTPTNLAPPAGQSGLGLTPWLRLSDFSDPDIGDYQAASHWRISATSGDYGTPDYDSGEVFAAGSEHIVPASSLATSTTYYWQGRYRDSRSLWSAWSSETSFATLADGELAAPEGLVAAAGASSVALSWQVHIDPSVTGFNVYRATNPAGAYTKINGALVTGTTYHDPNLNLGVTYYYRLTAKDGADNESAMTEPVSAAVGGVDIFMSDMTAEAGTVATQRIRMDNPNQIADEGMQVEIDYDPAVLRPTAIRPTALLNGFTFSDNLSSTTGTLVLAGVGSGLVIQGEGDLLEIDYIVAADAVLWSTSDLSFRYVELVDANLDPVAVNFSDAARITIARPNDPPAVDSIARLDPADELTNADPVKFRVAFSENVNGVSKNAFGLTTTGGQSGAQILSISSTQGTEIDVTVSSVAGAEGTVRLDLVDPGSILDDEGVQLVGSYPTGEHYQFDRNGPSVEAIRRENPDDYVTDAAVLTFRVTFSEPVVNLLLANFSVEGSGGQAAAVASSITSINATTYDVTVATVNSASGTVRLDLSDVTGVKDSLGNPLLATHVGDEEYLIDLPPFAPSNVAPAAGATEATLEPTLQITEFFDPNIDDLGGASEIQLRPASTDPFYTEKIINVVLDTGDLSTYGVPGGVLNYRTSYAWRARYKDEHGLWGAWSAETTFETEDNSVAPTPTPTPVAPARPVNLQPEDGAAGSNLTPTLRASDFSDADAGDFMAASQWRLRSSSGDYDSPVYESGESFGGSSTHLVSSGALANSSTYFWQVRYKDSRSMWSDWSLETFFQTAAPAALPAPEGLQGWAGTSSVRLTWLAHPDSTVIGYHIYRSTTGPGGLAKITTDPVAATEFLDAGLTPGTTYHYAITAESSLPEESAPTPAIGFTVGNVSISMTDLRGDAGSLVTQFVEVDNPLGIANAGLRIDIDYDPAVLTPVSVSKTTVTENFAITDNVAGAAGTLSIIGVDTGLELEAIGEMFELTYQVSASAPAWSVSTLSFSLANLEDLASVPLAVDSTDDATLTVSATVVPPTVISITRHWPSTSATNADHVVFSVEFSERVYNVGHNNFSIVANGGQEGAWISAVSRGIGNAWYVSVVTIYDQESDVRLDLTDPPGIHNERGVALAASAQGDESFHVDRIPPAIVSTVRSNPLGEIVRVPSVVFRATFSEPVTGVGFSNFNLYRTTGQAAAAMETITPVSDSVYDVTVSTVPDSSGVIRLDFINVHNIEDAVTNGPVKKYFDGESYTLAEAPDTPINIAPADSATAVSLEATLQSSAFSDDDAGDFHAASQWQIRVDNSPADFSATLYDSGADAFALTSFEIPFGTFGFSSLYYWRVRHTDNLGIWSAWSAPTRFTTEANQPPSTPTNFFPADGEVDVSTAMVLVATPFSDVNPGDSHRASHWQLRESSTASDYSAAILDSGEDTSNRLSIMLASDLLDVLTSYSWRVRYQDSMGGWSDWSLETSFTTRDNQLPIRPTNLAPNNGAADVTLEPTLQSSAFFDADAGDTHQASQWQIRSGDSAADYSETVLDSGATAAALTSIAVPEATLDHATQYAWRVRHKDGRDDWSDWSNETLFTTEDPPNLIGSLVLTGGSLNETDLLTSGREITVGVGDPISGTLLLEADNVLGADIPAPLGVTVDWGDRTNAGAIANGWVDPGVTSHEVAIDQTAPLEVGDYHLVAALGEGQDASQLMSATAPDVVAVWNDGNDLAFDWGAAEFGAAPSGSILIDRLTGSGMQQHWLPATAVTIHVVGPPDTPSNISPASGAIDVATTPTLSASAFNDPHPDGTHAASQWQIRLATSPADYSSPVFDSGTSATNLTSVHIGDGLLTFNTAFYWRVRFESSRGVWSEWSAETSFTTVAEPEENPFVPPDAPINLAPPHGQSGSSMSPTLRASSFSDSDPGDSMTASRWRIRSEFGNYDAPVYDSSVVSGAFIEHAKPDASGMEYERTYFWQVRYRDSHGMWSGWSSETSFVTLVDTSAIAVPTGFVARAGLASVRLTWNLHPDVRVVGYRLYRSTATPDNFALIGADPIVGTEYIDTNVDPLETYYYALAAISNLPAESDWTAHEQVLIGSATLTMNDLRGTPGSTVSQFLTMENPTGIANEALRIEVLFDPAFLTPTAVLTTSLTQSFAINADISTTPGMLVISGGATGATISGEGHLFEVQYQVAADAPVWEASPLAFGEIHMEDAFGGAALVDHTDAAVLTVRAPAMLGDLNSDGRISIVDAVLLRRIIIGQLPPTETQSEAGEINGDGIIDSGDLVLLLRMIVEPVEGSSPSVLPPPLLVAGLDGETSHTLYWGEQTFTDEFLQIPLYLSDAADLAGLDIVVNFDPSALELISVNPGSELIGFSWGAHEKQGQVKISLVDVSPSVTGAIEAARFHFVDLGGWETTPLTIAKFKGSDVEGANVSRVRSLEQENVELGTTQLRVFLDDVVAECGDAIELPIQISAATGIADFSFALECDTDAIRFASLETTGTLAEDWDVFTVNDSVNGRLVVSGSAGTGTPLVGDGVLAILHVAFAPSSLGAFPIDFANLAGDLAGALASSAEALIGCGDAGAPLMIEIGDQAVIETEALQVPISASDDQSDPISFSPTDIPAFASLTDNGNGTAALDVAPGYEDGGEYSVTISVRDDSEPPNVSSQTFTLTIIEKNRAPVLPAIADRTVFENHSINVNLSATDGEADAMSYSVTGLPSFGTLTDNGDGTARLTFSPGLVGPGTHAIEVTVTDSGTAPSLFTSASFELTVAQLVPPDIAPVGDISIPASTPYLSDTPTLIAGIADSWTLLAGAPGMTMDPDSGKLTWSDPVFEDSPYLVSIRATNALGSDSEAWLLHVDRTLDFTASDQGWLGQSFGNLQGIEGDALHVTGFGLCMDVAAGGTNGVQWKSPANMIGLTARTVYRIRTHVSTDQTEQGSIPIWDINYINSQNTGFLNFGGRRWFIDTEGGANGIGLDNGRDFFDIFIAPAAVGTPQWNGDGDMAISSHAFTTEASANTGIRLIYRVLDFDESLQASARSGAICISSIDITAIPLDQIDAASTMIYGPPLDSSTHRAFRPSSQRDPLLDATFDNVDHTLTYRFPSAAEATVNPLVATLGSDVAAMDLWITDPSTGATVRNPAKLYPVPWEADTLYRGRVAITADVAEGDPIDVIALVHDVYTLEAGGEDFVTSGDAGVAGGMAGAASPKRLATTEGTLPEWQSFFYGNNPTDSLISGARSWRMQVDFFNRPDIGISSPKDLTGSDAFTISSFEIDRVSIDLP